MCCSYAFNGMHLAQPTVMHFSTLLHHVECTLGALGARVRPTRILGPASGVATGQCVLAAGVPAMHASPAGAAHSQHATSFIYI